MRPPGVYPDGMPDNMRAVKRRSERRRIQIAVTLVIEGNEAQYLGNTVDLSQEGLCLQSDAPLTLGQPVGFFLVPNPTTSLKRVSPG
jgi:hypothetical protein